MAASFAHLRVHSDYSLGRGASKVKDMVKKVAAAGLPAFALVDENNLHGAMEAAKEAMGLGVQPVTGAMTHVQFGKGGEKGSILLLAQTDAGYANVCWLVNLALRPERAAAGVLDGKALRDIHAEAAKRTAGVICVAGCGADGVIGKALTDGGPDARATAEKLLRFLSGLFPGRLYVEICRNGHPEDHEVEAERGTLELARDLGLPIVATSDVWYVDDGRHDAFKILQAVSRNEAASIPAEGSGLTHAEPRRYGLLGEEAMAGLFSDLPEALANTLAVARRCAFAPAGRSPILPPFKCEGTEEEEMRRQAEEGLEARLDFLGLSEDDRGRYRERLAYELGVIATMKFPGYFLIVSDFIKWAKANDIPVGPGRGSGAGSVVAWSLFITDLDPLEFDLLFERFLNPARVSMPDFDVDFCQDHREKVIGYVKDKYGEDRVAQIATFTGMKSKGAFKDAGRVVRHVTEGTLSAKELNGLTNLIPPDKEKPAEPAKLAVAYEVAPEFRQRIDENVRCKVVFEQAKKIEGLFKNSSTHAAGIVIGGQPLTELVPVGFDPRSGMPVVQFNMKDAETAGLVKFDFLGLKTLSVIKLAVDYVHETNGGERMDIARIPLDDAPTYQMLAAGMGTAVFQFESEGMKRVLREMRPSRFEDLIAAVSLYRPGPMAMIPVYNAVKHGQQEPDYPEPADKTRPILEPTYGIMVYQEQVMAIAQSVAGYSLGDADLLRRAMGKKIKAEMDAQKDTFVKGAVERDVEAKDASSLFDKVAKFAEYGFNKSHAAAYALIAYQTAYLKCHYPTEFLAAFLSYESSAISLALVKHDLEKLGIEMLPPCVQSSRAKFAPERMADGRLGLRFGLGSVNGISSTVSNMVAERTVKGPYAGLVDFAERAGQHFNSGQVNKLAEVGAFDAIEPVRQRAAGVVTFLLKNAKADKGLDLFGGTAKPTVPKDILELPEWGDREQREHDVLGFYLRIHPLERNIEAMKANGVRRRSSIISYLREKELAETEGKKLHGLVEKVKYETSRKGMPYLRIQFAEMNERYWLSYFPRTTRMSPRSRPSSPSARPTAYRSSSRRSSC